MSFSKIDFKSGDTVEVTISYTAGSEHFIKVSGSELRAVPSRIDVQPGARAVTVSLMVSHSSTALVSELLMFTLRTRSAFSELLKVAP